MKQILTKRTDVVFFLKMFPLVQIHPDAYAKSKAVVCEKLNGSNEKALQLLEDAYDHKALPAPECDTGAVDDSLRLGQSFGVRGTPAMVFEDGSMVKGAVSEDALVQKLDSMK